MWWLIGSAPDCRSLGFESGISHNDPDALQDDCVTNNVENLRIERETYLPLRQKRYGKKVLYSLSSYKYIMPFTFIRSCLMMGLLGSWSFATI